MKAKTNWMMGIVSIFVMAAHTVNAAELTEDQSISYAIGAQNGSYLVRSLKRYETEQFKIDPAQAAKGFADALNGKSTMDEAQLRTILGEFTKKMDSIRKEKDQKEAAENKAAGEKFLAKNKTEKGVVTLPSGLQYKIVRTGKGKKPAATDTVKVHYKGTLLNGTEFDSSYKRNAPAEFPVGGVIKGWVEALQLMPVGSKWQLFVPADLAYGRLKRSNIPGNSLLIFDVELLDIVDKSKKEAAHHGHGHGKAAEKK